MKFDREIDTETRPLTLGKTPSPTNTETKIAKSGNMETIVERSFQGDGYSVDPTSSFLAKEKLVSW